MKKTSNTGRNVRSAGVRNAQVGTRSTSAKKSSSSSTGKKYRNTSRRKKNNSGLYAAIACGAVALVAIIAVVIAGSGIGGGNKKSTEESAEVKHTIVRADGTPITNADGSALEMTEAELKAALSGDTYPSGMSINGIDITGMTKDEALAAVKAQDATSATDTSAITVDIKLELDGQTYPIDIANTDLASNAEEIVEEAMSFVKPSSVDAPVEELVSCYVNMKSLETTPKAYTTAYTVKSDSVSEKVHTMLDGLTSEAVEATVTSFDVNTLQFVYTESKNGYAIDIEKATSDVKALLDSNTYVGTIVVDAEVTVPTLTTDTIKNEFGMITSSSSKTTTNNNRNHNIKITCEKLDGLVLQPGEEFSFNTYIGERTADKGYLEAGTIQGDKIEPALGGGICQVSSMIYQSVIKANLNVVERNPHRWPSTYAVAGTDAAVDWGSQDFIFVNDSDYPVALHAVYDNDNYTITVSIYGHLFPNGEYIEFVGETISTTPAGTVYVANGDLPVGTTDTVSSGHNGVTATSYQIWRDANGNEIKTVELKYTYYATIPTKIEVGTLNPDGSHATLNTETGELTGTLETEPSEETTESSEETSDTVVSDPTTSTDTTSSADPTETTASTEPTETTVTTEPTETTATTEPTETTAAPEPTETTAAPTEAPATEATEAPATEAPATEATEAPATEAPAEA